MNEFKNKVDFAVVLTVTKANPNGDPLNGNRPREDYEGLGEISDVCIKRKIRNRLQDMGENIFVQSSDRCTDGEKSLSDRAAHNEELKKAVKDKLPEKYAAIACRTWIDVRSFGQVFAFKSDSVSVGVRGPVSIRTAVSADPIDISTMQITKSVNSEPKEGGKSSDTMGSKNRVEFGVYTIFGSINHQLAEKTDFSEEDAEKIKEALATLFENDCSSARPDGSMEVKKVYWWKHNCECGQYSSAKVHKTLKIKLKDGVEVPRKYEDYIVETEDLEGLTPEIIEGR
ncbi:MAG TPA: type I-C CRISPR-associated protein Cas7/Csd2 [Lachnospiraceae bacterium]|nr:type I-C CRISPR-associated protein Cas7/Csd2 [Lachnospiraceae bacterium]